MKRITMFIATLAIGFAFVACGGSSDSKKDESKSDKDPAALINETFKSLYDALDDDTPDNFIRIYTEMNKLYESSSADLQKQFDKAEEDWFKKNPSKAQDLKEEVMRLYEMGFLNDSTSDDDSYGDDYSYYDNDDDDYSYYDDDDDDYSYYDDDDDDYSYYDDDDDDYSYYDDDDDDYSYYDDDDYSY